MTTGRRSLRHAHPTPKCTSASSGSSPRRSPVAGRADHWADDLYRGEVHSFESLVDRAYATRDAQNVARLLHPPRCVCTPAGARPGHFFETPGYGIDTAPSPGQQVIFDAFAAVAPRICAYPGADPQPGDRNVRVANPLKERPVNPVAGQEDRELADYSRRNSEGIAMVQNLMQNAGIPNPLGSFFGAHSGPENPLPSIPVGSEPVASQRGERREASDQKASLPPRSA